MPSDFNEILENSINYLKFTKDFQTFEIYKENLKEQDFEIYYDESFLNDNNNKVSDTVRKKIVASGVTGNNLFKEEWMNSVSIEELNELICNCTKCSLGKKRKNFVFGVGNPDADIVVVGEAPGADEDAQGEPFVGRAGKLLTDILKAINFTREEIFICNILKCRPPENRNPLPEEIFQCEPYLFKQLELIKPKLILATGSFAAQTLLKTKEPLGRMRGKFYNFQVNGINAKLLVTYHPAALLRNPNWKRPTWEDVQLFRKEYDKIKETKTT